MTDKEALEHILKTGDDFIGTLAEDMPRDLDLSKFTKQACYRIITMLNAGEFTGANRNNALTIITGLVGCILRLKFDTEIKAMLKAEEAGND